MKKRKGKKFLYGLGVREKRRFAGVGAVFFGLVLMKLWKYDILMLLYGLILREFWCRFERVRIGRGKKGRYEKTLGKKVPLWFG